MGRTRDLATFLGIGEEIVKRGWFAVNALRRIAGANDKAKQFDTEKRHYSAHKQASQDRQKVRRLMDANREVFGEKGGWHLGPNENHCVICLGANGKNFYFAVPPAIGYPGSAHPNCNCSAGAAFPGAPTLP